MIRIADKRLCCGCTACASVCPLKCIDLRFDEEGFRYPFINEEKCINCGACENVCPMISGNTSAEKNNTTELYGSQDNNVDARMSCTAGGIVSLIAEEMFKQGVNVYGCLYENMVVCHTIAKSDKDLNGFHGSKYVQSDLRKVFIEIKDKLSENKIVLFIGTPCQAHGLKNFIGNSENLFIIDLLCLGVSSPVLFSKWTEYLNKKYNDEVVDVQFRNKKFGYSVPNVKVCFKSGKSIEQKYDSKVYSKLFFRYYNVRPSCYECQFREVPRVSDITVGDFSDISKYSKDLDDDIGTTRVWVHTEKGKKIFSDLGSHMNSICLDNNTVNIIGGKKRQIVLPEDRDEFFKDLKYLNFDALVHKWQPIKIQDVFSAFVRPVINILPFKKMVNNSLKIKRMNKFKREMNKINNNDGR